jgi:hypothetical protein
VYTKTTLSTYWLSASVTSVEEIYKTQQSLYIAKTSIKQKTLGPKDKLYRHTQHFPHDTKISIV